jgi:hypothetical protein
MPVRTASTNFSKGEIAEELMGRFDVPAYNAGLARARNVSILKYGGVTKRPGTRVVAEVYDATQPVRLLPFQFSLENAYALEMGQGYMRPLALGGLVLEEYLKITAITKAVHGQVTAAFHNYVVGDQVFFADIVGMTEINGQIGTVLSVVDANNFTIDIDTTGYTTFISTIGTVRVGAPAPPPTPPVVTPPPPTPTPPPIYNGGYYSDDWYAAYAGHYH